MINFIKIYIEKQKNKSHLHKWESTIKNKVFNEILDPYIDWSSRSISYFDGDYVVFKDSINPHIDLYRVNGIKYRLSEKIPLIEVISDELLQEIKQFKRYQKMCRIM